jgi:hypothetical protein
MISFNTDDTNMLAIANKATLFDLMGRFGYRVYGLKQEARPLIQISVGKWYKGDRLTQIRAFLKRNGLPCEITVNRLKKNRVFHIGLRRDLREFVPLSARVIQTIVYFLEEKIELKPSFRIENLPKFK